MNTIERAMERLEFDFAIDETRFLNMSAADRKLTVDSLSEEEKWNNIRRFKTLPNGKVGWIDGIT